MADRSTGHPARISAGLDLNRSSLREYERRHERHAECDEQVPGDVAVLRLEKGHFGFTDVYGARMNGSEKLQCELTLRDGKVVYDLNGITRPDWKTLPKDYTNTGDARWDAIHPRPVKH